MYTPFNVLPSSSRVWIYQANTRLNSTQVDILSKELLAFTEQWKVHGQPMDASFQIIDDYFVVLAANEDVHAASGCSIDNSVRVIRQLGDTLGVDFFNRNNIAFRRDDQVKLISLSALKQKLEEGEWDADSLFYNNLVQQKSSLSEDWIVPAHASWLKRYLPQGSVSR